MSHSPAPNASSNAVIEYDKAWSALNLLIRGGKPFSGGERNCAFLNLGTKGTRFANISSASGLDFDDDGRGLAYADWDGDGDLDLWLTNRNGPRVRFIRNNTPTGPEASWLALTLQGSTSNRDAIGARVEIHLKGEKAPRIRTVTAGHGHLSQSSKTLHFGLGGDTPEIDRLTVRWPGGPVENFPAVAANSRYHLVQDSGVAKDAPFPKQPSRPAQADTIPTPKQSDNGRIIVLRPGILPKLNATDLNGSPLALNGEQNAPTLVNLWATWCTPCLGEMSEWAKAKSTIEQSGLKIVSISVDDKADTIAAFTKRIRYPYQVGLPGDDLLDVLDTVQRAYIGRQTDLPLPSSFLVDARGRLAAIYRGPVTAEQLIKDLAILGAPPREVIEAAIPFDGTWIEGPQPTNPHSIAAKFTEKGQLAGAAAFCTYALERSKTDPSLLLDNDRLSFNRVRGAVLTDLKDIPGALASWKVVAELAPDNRDAWLEIAACHAQLKETADAAAALEKALALLREDPENLIHLAGLYSRLERHKDAAAVYREALALAPSPVGHFKLATAESASGNLAAAAANFEKALALHPDWPPAANNLAWILATSPDAKLRNPKRAVALATTACEASKYQLSGALATLAAAYASDGRFEEAVKTNKLAVDLATKAGDTTRAAELRKRDKLFSAGKPFLQDLPSR